MSDAIFTLADGTAIATYKDSAWHNKGNVTGTLQTTQEAWVSGGFDRHEVIEEPLFTASGPVETHKVVRVKDDKGNLYKPFVVGANRPTFDFQMLMENVEAAVHATGGSIESLFRLREGALIGATVRLPDEIQIAGDLYCPYINVVDSIDASCPARVFGSDIRMVCWNTVSFALSKRDLSKTFSIRHTKYSQQRVTPQQIRDAVQIEIEGRESMEVLMDELLSEEFTRKEFLRLTDDLFGVPDKDAKTTRSQSLYDNRVQTLSGLFVADTQASTYRNGNPTKATALQSVIEFVDHKRQVKGDAVAVRFAQNMDGTAAVLKGKALAALTA